jgi:hypothetical protein
MMAWIGGRLGRPIVLGLVGGSVFAAAATAAPAPDGPHPENLRNRKVIETAYHAESDTYFQLLSDVVDKTGTGKWAYAVEKARRASFKGREGRLARIDNAELHQWVVETFDFADLTGNYGIWIGLRYWCGVRMLTWTDGDEHKPAAFAPWDRPWYGGDIRCGRNNIPYMGVYYTQQSQRWQAIGWQKRFRFYLVEYPPADPAQASASR